MVMGNSKNWRVLNFAILLKSRNLMLAIYTCFTVSEAANIKWMQQHTIHTYIICHIFSNCFCKSAILLIWSTLAVPQAWPTYYSFFWFTWRLLMKRHMSWEPPSWWFLPRQQSLLMSTWTSAAGLQQLQSSSKPTHKQTLNIKPLQF